MGRARGKGSETVAVRYVGVGGAALRALGFERLSESEQTGRSRDFLDDVRRRRSVRKFSRDPVSYELIENGVEAVGTAPSAAHQQPWTFVVVSDADVKRQIKEAAEEEERRSYESRMPDEWLEALRALGTGRKPHIEDAPYVVVVFEQAFGLRPDGSKVKHYPRRLAALTHTPSPMGFLRDPRASGKRAAVRLDPDRLPDRGQVLEPGAPSPEPRRRSLRGARHPPSGSAQRRRSCPRSWRR
jgi:iodotyrosine deiodinase